MSEPVQTLGRSRFLAGQPLPPVLTLAEVGAILGYARTRIYELFNAGQFERWQLKPHLEGTRPKFSGRKLQAYLDGEEPEQETRHYFGGARRRHAG